MAFLLVQQIYTSFFSVQQICKCQNRWHFTSGLQKLCKSYRKTLINLFFSISSRNSVFLLGQIISLIKLIFWLIFDLIQIFGDYLEPILTKYFRIVFGNRKSDRIGNPKPKLNLTLALKLDNLSLKPILA